MRNGFSLLTAIIFLVIVATLSTLALNFSTQSVQETTDGYLRSEAELLAQSGTEYALLALSGHDFSVDGCVNSIDIKYPAKIGYTHDINISIMYIGSGLPTTDCTKLGDDITTPDSNRTVILDTVVTTNPNISTEQIRIHRRTIQKP